jgi:CHASE2 domain-containing sensor protein/predicted Ser/Thr protein kinase
LDRGLVVGTNRYFPEWVIGLVVTLIFLSLTITGILGVTDAIEMKSFDFMTRIAASKERNPDIELVLITDNDISELGSFPWPRDMLAQCIDNIALAGAKVIAPNVLLSEPQEGPGFSAIRRLRENYEMSGLAQQGAGLAFYKELSKTFADLDNDTKLSKALEKAGNVVLPVYFDSLSTRRDFKIPNFVTRYAFEQIEGPDKEGAVYDLKWLSKLKPLLPSFSEVAAGVGHMNLFHDQDGYLRSQNYVLGYLKDIFFPSFSLAIVKVFKGIKNEDMTVVLGKGINLKVSPSSVINVPVINNQMGTLIKWSEGPGVAFHQTPFSKVLKGQIETSLFRDKIVIIGATATGVRERFATPISKNLPGTEVVANSVANILNEDYILRPRWLSMTELVMLFVFGLFITFVLPRLNALPGAFATLGVMVGYGGIGTILFCFSNIWLKISSPILLLVLGYVLLISKRYLTNEKTKEDWTAPSSEIHKMPGFNIPQESQFDLVLQELKRLPLDEEKMKDLLYTLGLGYEKNQQFSRALSTYKLIIEHGKDFRDLSERIRNLKDIDAAFAADFSAGRHNDEFEGTPMQMEPRPPFKRFELIQELGRGENGVVYQCQDIKSKRVVAVKAVNLAEYSQDIASEMKERFSREVESAGLLTHPNIVSIYDFGEENGLVYISMEYVEGTDLGHYTRPGHLLPLRGTLDIVARVADTLDYAHSKGVVHGDIKPANIIRVKETRDVKLTDFGIARIMPASKHKRGMESGFPYYMSPEQLSGKKVGGCSDVFSVGVLLFEMLTGQKPFMGEDISDLMLKIARDKHPSAKDLNPNVPRIVERILDRALEKDLEKRFQRAGQMASELKRVVARIDEILAQKTRIMR